jgi:hypothetical protein
MKQVQYRRAAQGVGFRPVQISGNEIARMREESTRVVQGMRDVRDAEIKERERQLADEKEAQRLEARLRDRNRQVETKNQQQVLTGLQQEARAKEQQFQQNKQDQTTILNSIANISQTASKVYQEQVEAAEDKTIAEELENYLQNPIEEDFKALQNELLLDTDDERRQALLDEYQINGGDPLVVAKSRNFSPRVRREILKGKATYFYQHKYPGLLQEAIRKQEERLGRPMDSAELAGYITDVGRIVSDKFRTEGGMSLKPGSMRTALEFQAKHHQSILSGARADEIKHENQRAADEALTILTQNPTEFEKNIIPSFRTIYRVNGFDYAKAHTWYTSLATMRGPDGNFMFSMEQLAGTVLQEGQKPYAQEFPGRYAAIQQARLEADNTYRNLQIKSENLAYKEAEQKTLQYITENNTQDVVDQAAALFVNTYGKVPESITKFQENYTLEAEAKAKQIEQLENIPDGFIIRENVEALKRLDVKAGNDLDKRYAAQEAKYNSGTYKELSDAFKTTANGVTTYGSQKPNSAASLALQRGMRAEFRRRVDRAVTGGADFNTSAELIAKQIEDEVRRDARSKDPDALFYRKLSGRPGGAAEFPNLYSKANLTAFEEARRNYLSIVQSVADNGLEKTLDTAESVLTREEITSIVEGYGKPGFTIPTDVLAVSGMGKGLDPFTIINRQIAALGDPNLLPLEPPAIIQSINNTMTEQQRSDLFNAVNGPRQRLRTLQQVAGTVAQPSNLRAGFAGNSLKRSFTDALVYEGNRGAYQQVGNFLQDVLKFQVAEHPDFGGVTPVHAGNSFHGYGEAFDITHQTGDYDTSIEKTRQLKDLIRSMNLFKEVIGPGDGDPAHATHLHLGGLMRPLTAEDIETLNSFK